LKRNTLFYCKDTDGDKHGNNERYDLNKDIKWGASKKAKKDGDKPTKDCKCMLIEDVPYSIIKKFKDMTYPKYEKFPDKCKWSDKKAAGKSIEKQFDPKVGKYFDELEDNVDHKGYSGSYDADRRRLSLVNTTLTPKTEDAKRNRLLYTIPFSSKFFETLRERKSQLNSKNNFNAEKIRTPRHLKGSSKILRRNRLTNVPKKNPLTFRNRLIQQVTTNTDNHSEVGTVLENGLMAGKSNNQSNNNENKEVHANSYQMESTSPDGFSHVTRQVADVVSTSN